LGFLARCARGKQVFTKTVLAPEDMMTIVYDGTRRSLGRRLREMFDTADRQADDRIGELLSRLMAVSASSERKRTGKDQS